MKRRWQDAIRLLWFFWGGGCKRGWMMSVKIPCEDWREWHHVCWTSSILPLLTQPLLPCATDLASWSTCCCCCCFCVSVSLLPLIKHAHNQRFSRISSSPASSQSHQHPLHHFTSFSPLLLQESNIPIFSPPPHPLNLTWACKGPGLPHSILRIILRALFPCLFVLSFSKSTLKSHPPADNESGTLPQSLSIRNQMHKSKSHGLLSAKDASISFSSHSLTLSPQPCFLRSKPDQSIHRAINPHGKKAHHHHAIENHESPENPKNKTPKETRRS